MRKIFVVILLVGAPLILGTQANNAGSPAIAEAAGAEKVAEKNDVDVNAKIARLETLLGELEKKTTRANDRGMIENLFSNYMYHHNAFRDEAIIDMWVKKGTPGIHAQYSNNGVYNTWESVTLFHRGRPTPVGKLILHYTTTPVIEVAGDGQTAKGLWIMAGLESGLTDPQVAAQQPQYTFSSKEVQGKKVWAHWVWCKYGIDFLKQEGVWKIWHFRCYEVARAPFDENWISYAEKTKDEAFPADLMYFGEDGKAVLMPKPDVPAKSFYYPYRPDRKQALEPKPPVPYSTFSETFEY
jgi:hypothetical protein